MFKKLIKIFLKAICIFLIIVISIILIDYLGLTSFYFISKNNYGEFIEIPGLNDGYVPQGICYIPKTSEDSSSSKDLVLETSYTSNGPSKLYVIDYEKKELIHDFTLKNSKDEEIHSHVGGVTVCKEKVWITGESTLYEYDTKSIVESNESSIKCKNEFSIPNAGDFCYFHHEKMNDNEKDLHYYNILWIGSFSTDIPPFYKGDTPTLIGYIIDDNAPRNEYSNPDYTVILPRTVQGLCIDKNNNFIFSRSYSGFFVSSIDIYENMLDSKVEKLNVNGKDIECHSYENSRRIASHSLPPMSEGLFLKDNNLYVVFESAAKRYLYAIPKIKHILSFELKY